jgi:hypothetical protein
MHLHPNLLLSLLSFSSMALAFPSPLSSTSSPNPLTKKLDKRNNIDYYTGCSASQKSRIIAGYKDALKLANHASPRIHDELFAPDSSAELFSRYFGAGLSADGPEVARIKSTYNTYL